MFFFSFDMPSDLWRKRVSNFELIHTLCSPVMAASLGICTSFRKCANWDAQLVLLRTAYSQAQGCGCTACASKLGGDVEQPWLTSKYDVIHKTGSTQRITTPPEEDRATAIGHIHRSFVEDRTCSFEDMKANRQTHYTYTQTDTFLTKRGSPIHGRPHIGANGVSWPPPP